MRKLIDKMDQQKTCRQKVRHFKTKNNLFAITQLEFAFYNVSEL